MKENDLPLWPSRGTRRKLDGLWLERLERQGIHALISDAEEKPWELNRAIGEFNNRLYWECHETLEHLWLRTPYPLRLFYHAIIKVAVGFYHGSRHNRHGTRTKLADGMRLLSLFQPSFLGVRTDLLHRDVSVWLTRVEGKGPIDWRGLDALPTPHIHVMEEGGDAKPIDDA